MSLLFAAALCASCKDEDAGALPPGGNNGGDLVPPGSGSFSPCGNQKVDGLELCDGQASRISRSCFLNAQSLGGGVIGCDDCVPLFYCDAEDVCAAVGWYNNGACDACDLLGGGSDAECATSCASEGDGVCGERYDPWTGVWVCAHAGLTDSDCGTCGDGVRQGNELCDGNDFPADFATCADYGLGGHPLGCRSDCTPDFGFCRTLQCGDGILDAGEACDGNKLGGATCAGFGFLEGQVTCTLGDCLIDTSGCSGRQCGNGVLDGSEECDGANLDGETCASLNFGTGTLHCSDLCNFDTSLCSSTSPSSCGDGVVNGMDLCDGTAFDGGTNTCAARRLGDGQVSCTPTCTLDMSGCTETNLCAAQGWYNEGTCDLCALYGGEADPDCNACGADDDLCPEWFDFQLQKYTCSALGSPDPDCGTCGNGALEGGEQCDGQAFKWPFTCAQWGYAGGTLGCRANCTPDFKDCTL